MPALTKSFVESTATKAFPSLSFITVFVVESEAGWIFTFWVDKYKAVESPSPHFICLMVVDSPELLFV